jgi:hypothetical protein
LEVGWTWSDLACPRGFTANSISAKINNNSWVETELHFSLLPGIEVCPPSYKTASPQKNEELDPIQCNRLLWSSVKMDQFNTNLKLRYTMNQFWRKNTKWRHPLGSKQERSIAETISEHQRSSPWQDSGKQWCLHDFWIWWSNLW